jgi:hypothetical protein
LRGPHASLGRGGAARSPRCRRKGLPERATHDPGRGRPHAGIMLLTTCAQPVACGGTSRAPAPLPTGILALNRLLPGRPGSRTWPLPERLPRRRSGSRPTPPHGHRTRTPATGHGHRTPDTGHGHRTPDTGHGHGHGHGHRAPDTRTLDTRTGHRTGGLARADADGGRGQGAQAADAAGTPNHVPVGSTRGARQP